MRDDPIFSGGFFKIALVLLVAGGLGLGAYSLAGGGVHINLPDLPEIDTAGDTTNLTNTSLSDTTIGEDTVEQPTGETLDPFTTAGFGAAIAKVKAETGPGAQLTRLFINEVQTQFIVRKGANGAEAYSVRAENGELTRDDATITISGNAKLDDFQFGLDSLDPAAVDRMLAAARKESGAADFAPSVLSLERQIPFGSRALKWTINATANSHNLLFRADADGRKLENPGGKGTAIPQAAIDAQKLNDCIQAAGTDTDEVLACLDH